MFAARFLTFFLAIGAVAVSATPVPAEEQAGISKVMSVVNTLQAKTATILPQIDSLVSRRAATEASVAPFISELVTALNAAQTSLATVGFVGSTQGSSSEVANAISPVIKDITTSLNGASAAVPNLAFILPGLGLEIAIQELLVTLNFLVGGVIIIVGSLLGSIVGLLNGLAFGLLIGLLGL